MTGLEILAIQIGPPEVVRLRLIHHHRALFATVAGQVALPVAIDVDAAHHDGSFDGGFPYPGVDGFVPPLHVLGHAHIDRNEPAHCVSSWLTPPEPRSAVRRRRP